MTIRVARLYFEYKDDALAGVVARSQFGLTSRIDSRIKPMREQLRGPEARDVNIFFFESVTDCRHCNSWLRLVNTFEHGLMFDPKPLIDVDSVENVRCLLRIASQVRALALRPWMRTVAAGLEKPLIAIDAVAGEGSREKWPAYLAEVGSPRRASGQVIGSPPEQHYCYRFVAIYDTATD